jgi:hypothetical protein
MALRVGADDDVGKLLRIGQAPCVSTPSWKACPLS